MHSNDYAGAPQPLGVEYTVSSLTEVPFCGTCPPGNFQCVRNTSNQVFVMSCREYLLLVRLYKRLEWS